MKNKTIIILLIITMASFTQCKKKTKPPSNSAYPVLVTHVTTGDVPVYLESFGTLLAPININLTAQVNGQIINMPIAEGSFVRQGDVIAQLDPRVYETNLEAAKANLLRDQASLLFAEQNLASFSQLIEQNFVSNVNIYQYEQNVSQAKAAIAADIASIKQAELNMEFTRITAPIDGVIGLFAVQQGNWVNAGSQNATITNLMQVRPLYAMYALPEKDLGLIKEYYTKGPLKVIATLLEDKQKAMEGEVFALNNTVDSTTGTIMLKATFANKDLTGWPGQFVRVKTQLYVLEKAMIVPGTAVQTGQKGPFVYVLLPNSTVDARPVVQGEFFDDKIVILSGLELGDLVVVDGQVNLYAGAPVQPQEELPTQFEMKA